MALTLQTEYWDDPEAKAAFQEFIREIHGLDFSAWDEAGYWDHRYTPFSYFEGDRVIASMCTYLLDAVIEGENAKIVQISGVGTDPEYRRQGLNRELTEIGLAWAARNDPVGVFLFSDAGAIPFYAAGGFEAIEEYVEFLPRNSAGRGASPPSGLVSLDPAQKKDRERIYGFAQRRAPLSRRFSVMNPKLVMFHCIYQLPHAIVEIPELDCIVLADRQDGVLRIYDLLAEQIPSWDRLAPILLAESDREIEFHFYTDRLGVPEVQRRPLRGNHPYVRPGFPLAQPVFPYTARA